MPWQLSANNCAETPEPSPGPWHVIFWTSLAGSLCCYAYLIAMGLGCNADSNVLTTWAHYAALGLFCTALGVCLAMQQVETFVGLIVAAFCVAPAAHAWLRLSVTDFPADAFDGPIFQISTLMATGGRTPYRDFSIVYPPGVQWLMGLFWGAPDVSGLYRRMGMGVALVSAYAVYLAVKLFGVNFRRMDMRFAGILAVYFVNVATAWESQTAQSLVQTLIITLVMAIVLANFRRTHLIHVGVVSFLTCLCLWDKALFLALTQVALVAFGMTWVGFSPPPLAAKVLPTLRWFATVAGVQALACAGALLTMFGWAHRVGVAKRFLEVVFVMPSFKLLPYRTLPMPEYASWLDREAGLVVALGALGLAALAVAFAVRSQRLELPVGILFVALLMLPLAYLPYALGRSEPGHYMPLVVSASIIMAAIGAHRALPRYAWFLGFLPLISQFNYVTSMPRDLRQGIQCERAIQEYAAHLEDCQKVFPSDARSMFVGFADYTRFIVNAVALYYLMPNLIPASSFISDEPGLQNDCIYGNWVADDLTASPKPMVAYLVRGLAPAEANATAVMQSCRQIESRLTAMPSRYLASCTAFGLPYDVYMFD